MNLATKIASLATSFGVLAMVSCSSKDKHYSQGEFKEYYMQQFDIVTDSARTHDDYIKMSNILDAAYKDMDISGEGVINDFHNGDEGKYESNLNAMREAGVTIDFADTEDTKSIEYDFATKTLLINPKLDESSAAGEIVLYIEKRHPGFWALNGPKAAATAEAPVVVAPTAAP